MHTYSMTLNSENDTKNLATQLATQLASGLVFLQGDLGLGKTTLARYWLRALGITGSIKSPTYTLVETYKRDGGAPIFHFDLYRLTQPDELDMMGFDEYAEQIKSDGALVIIEWATRATTRLPVPDAVIEMSMGDDKHKDSRHVCISAERFLTLIT